MISKYFICPIVNQLSCDVLALTNFNSSFTGGHRARNKAGPAKLHTSSGPFLFLGANMPNRAQRRAAARRTMQAAAPASTASPSSTIPEAQLAANRANAEKSTGPKTEAPKLISSHNAVETGLTGTGRRRRSRPLALPAAIIPA
jgi:hypothetical protein